MNCIFFLGTSYSQSMLVFLFRKQWIFGGSWNVWAYFIWWLWGFLESMKSQCLSWEVSRIAFPIPYWTPAPTLFLFPYIKQSPDWEDSTHDFHSHQLSFIPLLTTIQPLWICSELGHQWPPNSQTQRTCLSFWPSLLHSKDLTEIILALGTWQSKEESSYHGIKDWLQACGGPGAGRQE